MEAGFLRFDLLSGGDGDHVVEKLIPKLLERGILDQLPAVEVARGKRTVCLCLS